MGRLCLRFKDGKLTNEYLMACCGFWGPWQPPGGRPIIPAAQRAVPAFPISHAARPALAGVCGGSFMTIERALIVSMTQKQTQMVFGK